MHNCDCLSPLLVVGESFPDMPTLHYREAYEPAIMYQHLSLWDALSLTEGVSVWIYMWKNILLPLSQGGQYNYLIFPCSP